MSISRHTKLNELEIWDPKYSSRLGEAEEHCALLACFKVGTHNKVIFTRAKHLLGQEFYVSGETARSCPTVSNGSVKCYEVPMSALEPLEYDDSEPERNAKAIICILKHVNVVEVWKGKRQVFACSAEGDGVGEPLEVSEADPANHYRLYICRNCGAQEDASEEFTMRAHLGKMHSVVDPWNAQ